MDDMYQGGAMWKEQVLGWRARVGLILPSTNLLLETALPRMAPEGVTFHAARLTAGRTAGADDLRKMARNIVAAAIDLASAKVDLIAYCCTASSFIEGSSHDGAVSREILEATGIRTITTMRAIVDALKELEIRHLAMLSPYTRELEEMEARYLEQEGFKIVASSAMEIRDMIALHYPSPAQIYRLARTTCTDEADGLLISCNALRAHTVVSELEHDLRKPVITSLTATLWGILRAAGIRELVAGYGRLFERL